MSTANGSIRRFRPPERCIWHPHGGALPSHGRAPDFSLDGVAAKAAINFYEVLEPRGAQPLASFTNTPEKSSAITINAYDKGRAIYVSVPAQMSALEPLMRSLYSKLDIARGPDTPRGVYARVVEGRRLYVDNTEIE